MSKLVRLIPHFSGNALDRAEVGTSEIHRFQIGASEYGAYVLVFKPPGVPIVDRKIFASGPFNEIEALRAVLYGEASLLYFLAGLNEFSNLGKGPGTMKVPYAEKWQKETDKLRQIALDCDLTEELKWGKPCFTFLKKNVAIVIPLKESCAFSFFKGALLKDPKHILDRIGEHTQAGRWIKFTSLREIAALRSTLKDYLYEAIELEESGKNIEIKKPSEYPIPEELQSRLDDNAVLRSAFATLTPGRRKSIIFHVSSAKQTKTRAARAEKCMPMILSGRGFNELPS